MHWRAKYKNSVKRSTELKESEPVPGCERRQARYCSIFAGFHVLQEVGSKCGSTESPAHAHSVQSKGGKNTNTIDAEKKKRSGDIM